MATVSMPISLQARMIRSAISPRFAIRIRLYIGLAGEEERTACTGRRAAASPHRLPHQNGSAARVDLEQRLAVIHGLFVLDQHRDHASANLGRDLVEDLHRFDDANRL